jgi:hypothetical protein
MHNAMRNTYRDVVYPTLLNAQLGGRAVQIQRILR